MIPGSGPKNIVVREIESFDDLQQLKRVEKEVWSLADDDSIPLTIAIALKAAGNMFLGAFEGEKLIGFAFAFFGRENGQPVVHSHMLAVLEPYRRFKFGARLKWAQREWALARGVQEITWTFDPLQNRNAHFNFARLGVAADTYKVDFYGPQTSSLLHQNGTDRLWVKWVLDSRRVKDRLAGKDVRMETVDTLRHLVPLVRFNGDGKPVRTDLSESLARQRLSIEIPSDILDVEHADMSLAREWRAATRWAFVAALEAGFFVSEYCRSIRGQQGPGAYLLEKGRLGEFVLQPA
jgi:predicted GNAT superfamily acetyltransferase